ncbi:hypothetical protein MW887_003403 [Aspergillus wentii]|nr:hypothetical protein MW887_003403 [Aspergillus wentii]
MPKHLEYFPLDSERNEIRLLTIFPSVWTKSTIRCSLEAVSLDDNPDFEAISYVWGDASNKTDIIINDALLYVTLSVETSLRLLRDSHQQRAVWIDFVCIDQDDVIEKSTQVPLMGRIYASASSVIAMIGTESRDIRAAISWINAWVEEQTPWEAAAWRILDCLSKYSKQARNQRAKRLVNLYDGLKLIMDAPYWTRMWTFQEYQLAKSHPICMCGKLTFNAEVILSKANSTLLQKYWSDQAFKKRFQQKYGQMDVTNFENMAGQVIRRDLPILDLLLSTSHRRCKDPRDKVYALYSLFPSLQAKYPADYTKPLGQIMHETTAFIIAQDGMPDALSLFRPLENHLSSRWPYPSWVLDFTRAAQPSNEQLHCDLWCRGRDPKPMITNYLSTLTIWARRIGVCSPVLQFGSTILDVIKQILDIPCTRNDAREGAITREIILQQAFLAHTNHIDLSICDFLYENASKDIHRANDPRWKALCDLLSLNAGKIVFEMSDSLIDRFGIGGPNVQRGDVAVAAVGVSQPLILRPYFKNKLYYRLVDNAYIHGVSDSALRNDRSELNWVLDLQLQVFDVR